MRKAEAYAPIVAKLVELSYFSLVHGVERNVGLLETIQQGKAIDSELEGRPNGALNSI